MAITAAGDEYIRRNAVGVGDAWSAFSVDVSIETQRLDAGGKPVWGEPPLFYHLTRQITPVGTWNLILTFGSRARQAVTNAKANLPAEPWEVARFEEDGDGSPPRLFDGAGRARSMQLPPGILAGGGATGRIRPGSAEGRRSPAADRRWVSAFVLAPAGAAARSAALTQRFGPAVRTATGADEYRTQRDSMDVIVDADPETGAINSMVETNYGRLVARWTMTYQKNPDGSYFKRQVRVESPAGPHDPWRRVTVTTFSNVTFGRRAGR